MALAAATIALAGCGESTRQDANDKDASFDVAVTDAAFPARQDLAEETEMTISVRNLSDETIPNLAATIDAEGMGTQVNAFGTLSEQPGLAARSRPVWIVQQGPSNGDTAYANTWALGPVAAGKTKTFVWRVAAIRSGTYRLTYRLAGSLPGGAKLLDDGETPTGRFDVKVTDKPGDARITADGEIVRESGR